MNGIAAKALQTALTPSETIIRNERLRRAMMRSIIGDPTYMNTAVGVTQSVGDSATIDATLTNIYPANASLLNIVSYSGGRPRPGADNSTSQIAFPVASCAPAITGNLQGLFGTERDISSWAWEIEFNTDADKIQIGYVGFINPVYGFRVLIDGRYISKLATSWAVNGNNYITIDRSGVRTPTKIKIEVGGQIRIRDIRVSSTAQISKPYTEEALIGFATGDSYSEGQGGILINAWTKMFARAVGITDLRQVAVGGTGILQVGFPEVRSKIRDQIDNWFRINDDIAPNDVDILTDFSGFNDHGLIASGAVTLTQLREEKELTLAKFRKTCPKAMIIVGGSWTGRRGLDATTLAIENINRQAFLNWNDPRSMFIPVASATPAFVTGTGRVGQTSGIGNSDIATSTDGLHPSDLGHAILSSRSSDEYRRQLTKRYSLAA